MHAVTEQSSEQKISDFLRKVSDNIFLGNDEAGVKFERILDWHFDLQRQFDDMPALKAELFYQVKPYLTILEAELKYPELKQEINDLLRFAIETLRYSPTEKITSESAQDNKRQIAKRLDVLADKINALMADNTEKPVDVHDALRVGVQPFLEVLNKQILEAPTKPLDSSTPILKMTLDQFCQSPARERAATPDSTSTGLSGDRSPSPAGDYSVTMGV